MYFVVRSYLCFEPHTDIRTIPVALTQTYIISHTATLVHTRTHTYVLYTPSHAHTSAHNHTYTHTYTRTYAHTHTHMHARAPTHPPIYHPPIPTPHIHMKVDIYTPLHSSEVRMVRDPPTAFRTISTHFGTAE